MAEGPPAKRLQMQPEPERSLVFAAAEVTCQYKNCQSDPAKDKFYKIRSKNPASKKFLCALHNQQNIADIVDEKYPGQVVQHLICNVKFLSLFLSIFLSLFVIQLSSSVPCPPLKKKTA